jgi:hypothetical protein
MEFLIIFHIGDWFIVVGLLCRRNGPELLQILVILLIQIGGPFIERHTAIINDDPLGVSLDFHIRIFCP